MARKALAIKERVLSPDDDEVGISLTSLALILQAENRLTEAEPMLRPCSSPFVEKCYGPRHPEVAIRLNNLGSLLGDLNQVDEAGTDVAAGALAIDEQSYGAEHPQFASHLNNLAVLFESTDRNKDAEPLLRRALAISERCYGSEHQQVASSLFNLALKRTPKLEPSHGSGVVDETRGDEFRAVTRT